MSSSGQASGDDREPRTPSIVRGYVTARGLQVHYAECGAGSPAVVLLHEVPRGWTQFGPCMPHLGRFTRCIAVDLPGYGMSDPFPSRATAIEYADVIGEAIGAIAGGPVLIAGVHSGALFAVQIAARRLVDVVALALTGLPMFGSTFPDTPKVPDSPLGETYDGGHVARIVPHFQEKWGYDGPTHRYHDAALQALQAVDRVYVAYEAVFECDVAPLLPTLECETWFLSAEQDALYAHDRAAATMLPSARSFVARGIGRDLPWCSPVWYSSRVLAAMGIDAGMNLDGGCGAIGRTMPHE